MSLEYPTRFYVAVNSLGFYVYASFEFIDANHYVRKVVRSEVCSFASFSLASMYEN